MSVGLNCEDPDRISMERSENVAKQTRNIKNHGLGVKHDLEDDVITS